MSAPLTPELREHQEALVGLCRSYSHAWMSEDQVQIQLLTGMLLAQCIRIYQLHPPAGLMPIPEMLQEIAEEIVRRLDE
jgi:hypothetical protein